MGNLCIKFTYCFFPPIGHGMNREVIQNILDECLLTDEEMTLGPKMWKETMEEFDNINLELEQEECRDEECEDEDCDNKDDKNENEFENEEIGEENDSDAVEKSKKRPISEGPNLSKDVKRKKA